MNAHALFLPLLYFYISELGITTSSLKLLLKIRYDTVVNSCYCVSCKGDRAFVLSYLTGPITSDGALSTLKTCRNCQILHPMYIKLLWMEHFLSSVLQVSLTP